MNNPITAIITVVSPPHGRGPNEKKRDFKQYFGRNERQLIPSANDNKLCLFYALELSRIYHDEKIIKQMRKKGQPISTELITRHSFSRILKDDLRKYTFASQLLNEIGADPSLDSYGFDVLPLVQEFYDMQYPGLTYYLFSYLNRYLRTVPDRCYR